MSTDPAGRANWRRGRYCAVALLRVAAGVSLLLAVAGSHSAADGKPSDKTRAVSAIFHIPDFDRFLVESGFNPGGGSSVFDSRSQSQHRRTNSVYGRNAGERQLRVALKDQATLMNNPSTAALL